jgi:lipid-A-disaccharide synthase
MEGLRPRVREIFLSAGEASGDLHGAELVRRLKASLPGTTFTCLGGPALADAGANVLVDNRELSVVGLFEVFRHARVITAGLRRIRHHLTDTRPDLVILIDFPDFNFLLMRIARALGIPVFYYISPQIWAWRRGRVRTLKRLANDMAVILPFEVDFYAGYGMEVHYVGHPLVDVLEAAPSRAQAAELYRRHDDRSLVGLLPGSRQGEVRTLLPILMESAARIGERRPDVDFIIPLAPSIDPGLIDGIIKRWPIPVRTARGDTYGVIRACDLIITASGTVTLEAAILGTPMIITYKLSNLSYHAGRHLIRVDRAGLPNLIAGKLIAPELLQKEANPARLTEEALSLLNDPARLARQRIELEGIRGLLGEPGVVNRVASLVLNRLGAGAKGTELNGSKPALEPDESPHSGSPRAALSSGRAGDHSCSSRPRGDAPLPSWVRTVYGLGWGLIWPQALLYYRLRSLTDGKYASSHLHRMGLIPPDIKVDEPTIWIHALSVGETLSVAPLVRALKQSRPEAGIVFSTATETGQRLARKTLAPWVRSFFYLPHDLPLVMDRLVHRIRPELFIQVETDLWPNLLCALHRHGIVAVLVNGRLSPGSFRSMLATKGPWSRLLKTFQTVYAQSEADRDRYLQLGVEPARLQVTGNLKFDAAPPELLPSEVADLKESIGLPQGRPVWIAGSTHRGEEEPLLRTHAVLSRRFPDLLLILAPRQPGRCPEIMELCRRVGLKAALRSRGEIAEGRAVLLLDTLGELGRFYAVADVGFIGGSRVPFGGHNPLEAAAQGKPACWGPHLFNFREMESALADLGCFMRVDTEDQLERFLRSYLADPALRAEASRRAKELVRRHRGVAQRLVQSLLSMRGKSQTCPNR